MKISIISEYALLALIQLCRSQNEIEINKLRDSQHIPAEYLSEIISVLNVSGYLHITDGIIRQIPTSEQITVAEIIRLFDGALAPLEPVSSKGYINAPMDSEEKLSGLFENIQVQIMEHLENTSIADLI